MCMNILLMLAAVSVTFVECEKRDKRMRIDATGEKATINVCRLRDVRSDAATLKAHKAAVRVSSAADSWQSAEK